MKNLQFQHRYHNNHISPTELEDILQKHPAVKECLVYGQPSAAHQEIVTACVVVKPRHTVRVQIFV